MTCIAWRNGIMASDSCWTDGDTIVASAIKIKRLSSGALLGQSGGNDCRAIELLLDKVKSYKRLPTKRELLDTKDEFMGLLALPDKTVWVISTGPVDETGWPAEGHEDDDYGIWSATTLGDYAAVGSGSDFALAAMDVGAAAAQGVAIACRRSIHCRLPVHTRRLTVKTK